MSNTTPGDRITAPDFNDIAWAQEDLGPDATHCDIRDLAATRADLKRAS